MSRIQDPRNKSRYCDKTTRELGFLPSIYDVNGCSSEELSNIEAI
jgi:hypothetical protein